MRYAVKVRGESKDLYVLQVDGAMFAFTPMQALSWNFSTLELARLRCAMLAHQGFDAYIVRIVPSEGEQK